MKKIILMLIIALGAISIQAQERTVSKTMEGTYISIPVTSADVFVKTTRDTTDYKIRYAGVGYVKKVGVHVDCDTIDGADTLSVQLLGYDFYDDITGDVIIAADTTEIASRGNIILTDDYMTAADEFSFRYYVIRIRHLGVGNGCLAKEIELKLYTE